MSAKPGDREDAPAERPTVLVVDDEGDLADLYGAWLSEDFDVRIAYDGSSALDQLDDDVDVVLLDRRMPDLSGDEVLDTIRERSLDCRVAMVTAVEPDLDIVDLGFDDYLQKPVDRGDLTATVEKLLRRADYDDRLQQYFGAIRKRTLLESRYSPAERADNEEFQALERRISELEAAVEDAVSELDDRDFQILFRQMD